ncbi:putative nuclear transport factor 2, NTF2-like domain superfamily [Helianthus annuus]|nr:putative nuclear transport factor 2, NTF2-like domain superfamily [Helianthus annuus]
MNQEQELAAAEGFVRRYFELLDTNPVESASVFDDESSEFFYDRIKVVTSFNIVGKLSELSSKGCSHNITTMDFMLCEMEDRGTLVSVNGRLKVDRFDNDDDDDLVFSQVYHQTTSMRLLY